MAKKTSLAEAILEAKDLKNIMKSNVEKTLLENLQPRIAQLVSKNLQEMEGEYEQEDEDMDETLDIASLMQEVEDETDEAHDGGEESEIGGEGYPETDESDVSVADMSKEDLTQIIKDVIQGILGGEQAGEVDSTDMEGGDEMSTPDEEGEMDEEGMYEGLDELVNEIMGDISEAEGEDDESLQEQVKSLKKENDDLKKANGVYKKALNESKLSLVQLSYINGLIVESKLSNEQIIKFTEILEKTKTVEEAKNVYDAINESVKTKAPKQAIKTQKIKESYGLSSNQILPNNKVQTQNDDPFVARLKRNAYK